MTFKTEQESFWAGEFGDDYIKRNQGQQLLASNLALFTRILSRTERVESLIEFGANIGMNIHAFKQLLPSGDLSAIEINEKAVQELKKIDDLSVIHNSLLEFIPQRKYDMSFIKGVLIHINPDALSKVYEALYHSSSRYICIIEYYNPSPVEVPYRGHKGKLFKRDFAGEMLDKYSDLTLVDYGFCYHRDTLFAQDDLNWFLLEKNDCTKWLLVIIRAFIRVFFKCIIISFWPYKFENKSTTYAVNSYSVTMLGEGLDNVNSAETIKTECMQSFQSVYI